MKLFIPQNIFTSIFLSTVPENSGIEIIKMESALICEQLEINTSAVALIPSLELLNHQTLFVSNKLGLSFDGILSNAYLLFAKNERKIAVLKVRGDISINEIILSKILFSERYSSELEINLDTAKEKTPGKDYLVVGDQNIISGEYKTAISFADQIAELIDLPYVNYVFASRDEESLNMFNSLFADVDFNIEENITGILTKMNLDNELKNFISENLRSIYYEMTDNEVDAVNELIKLVYYHGIIDDLFDVKFI